MDYEDILKKLREVNTFLLREYFKKGMTDSFSRQLEGVLATNYEESSYRNVTGSVFYRGNDLELLVVKPTIIRAAEQALAELGIGSHDSVKYLSYLVEKALEKHEQFDDEGIIKLLKVIPLGLENIAKKGFQCDNDEEEVVNIYKKCVLAPMFCFCPEEFQVGKGFASLFTVLNDLKPSEKEIEISQGTGECYLIFSAKEDYTTSGVRIYVINSEDSELLYDGKLEVDNE